MKSKWKEKMTQRGVAFSDKRWHELEVAGVLSTPSMTRPELINKLVDEYFEKKERLKAKDKQE